MKIYAGVGSRQTPPEVLSQMVAIAQQLGRDGWLLRSGGADGADKTFEQGCDDVHGKKEILLPWRRFNGNQSSLWIPNIGKIRDEAMRIAAEVHPAWLNVTAAGRLLHARNSLQVLGPQLDEPVNLVICWTTQGRVAGGTATAIKLAYANKIPVFNLGNSQRSMESLWEFIGTLSAQVQP
jgi:hypothetical protein